MKSDTLQICMLGRFSLRRGGKEISDSDNRSRKVWLLLAYLICCRGRTVSQEELIDLLWNEQDSSANPANALKAVLHRLRSSLDLLGDDAGRTLIQRCEGGYTWNMAQPFSLDTDEFETLCKPDTGDGSVPERYLKGLSLYEGAFLPKLSSEAWVVPISAFYHSLYIQTVQSALSLLEQQQRFSEGIQLARRAIELEPFDETIYQHLMRALLECNEQREAAAVYRNMSTLLFSTFGVTPSDACKALYREATRAVSDTELELGMVREQLRAQGGKGGALLCDYDYFKVLYHATARAVARSGDAVQIAMLSVSGSGEKLSRRSLDICMDNLGTLACRSLRRGDVVSRCSVSQFILLLPQSNYENACKVMERICKTFARQYPHSPAILRRSVQPLEPIV